MTTAADFRIESVQAVTLNGNAKITFRAFKKEGNDFVFLGQFTAPPRTAKRDLWMIADGQELPSKKA